MARRRATKVSASVDRAASIPSATIYRFPFMAIRVQRTVPCRPAAADHPATLEVEIVDRQRAVRVPRRAVGRAVRAALARGGVHRGEVSVAIVDDAEIARVHSRFLNDPTPTDCISFVFDSGNGAIDGEIVVSAETAAVAARRFGWSASDELLLYVAHAALHLAGYDDQSPAQRRAMRRQERAVLAELGICPPRFRRRAARSRAAPKRAAQGRSS